MLHWLAGQRQPDGPTDPDITGYIDPPETPAPVFAVRAFKHAIFGTPQTAQPKPRRNSTTDNGRLRNVDIRPPRPGMNRPKSSNDAQVLGRQQQLADVLEPMSSPTKGILLTPGTAAGKKKNVTFGDHLIDNEGKRPMKNGLPEEGPNKSQNADLGLGDDSDVEEDGPQRHRSRTKLTETFEQVRDESKKRRSKTDKRAKKLLEDDIDVPPEFVEPKSEAGKYWKREYDVYRTNTQREVKKLITKQKAAKDFAQTMDEQCSFLAHELRHEQTKVETLEAKMEELTTLMKDLAEQLTATKKEAHDRTEEVVKLQRQNGRKDSVRPESGDYGVLVPLEKTKVAQRADREATQAEADPVQRPSEPYQPLAETEKRKVDLQMLRARVKSKPDSKPTKQTDDIWAQSFGSSSPIATRSSEKTSRAAIGVKVDNSGINANALQTLDVNTLGSARDIERDARPGSSSEEPRSPLDPRAGVKSSERDEQPGQLPPKPPAHTSSLQRPASADSTYAAASAVAVESKPEDDWSLPISAFGPLPPDAQPKAPATTTSRRTPAASTAALSGPREAPTVQHGHPSINTKENISPLPPASSKAQAPPRELNAKPSALWSSMNAAPATQRADGGAGRVNREGRQVSNDRIEAAKARLQARKVGS